MKRRVFITSAVLFAMVSIMFYIVVDSFKTVKDPYKPIEQYIVETNNSDNSDTGTVESETQTPSSSKDFEFDKNNFIITQKTEEDFMDIVELGDIKNGYEALGDGFDFSNGFFIKSSDILTLDSVSEARISLFSPDNSKVYVTEIDPIMFNQDSAMFKVLEEYGFTYYANNRKGDIPDNAQWDKDNGLKDWEQYFGGVTEASNLFYNPTKVYDNFILSDYYTDTDYGVARCIVIYNKVTGMYSAEYIILCDKDRLLKVTVNSEIREDLYNYLMEVTSNCIELIK